MELRGRRRQYREDDSDAEEASSHGARASPDSGAPRPSVSANVHQGELAIAQRRASRAQRGRKSHGDDSDGDDHEDALSEEKLQKQLRTVTDEKEIKRIKRLLRNRVSAQQARERKKQYVSELEHKIAERDETIKALQRELKQAATANATLRRLIVTMRGPGHSAAARARAVGATGERPPSADGRLQAGVMRDGPSVRQGSGVLPTAAPPAVAAGAPRAAHSAASQGPAPSLGGGGGGGALSLRYSVDSAQLPSSAHHSLRKLHGMPDTGSMQLSDSDALVGGGRDKASQDPLDMNMSLTFGSSGDWPAMRAPG